MDDVTTLLPAVAIGVVMAVVVALIIIAGIYSGKSELTGDCDNFGAFMVEDAKYECRRVGK
jgi:hypothetical protein